MVDNRPRRRKSKDNPYTLFNTDNKYYVEFKDIVNKRHCVEISQDVYNVMDGFELDDKSEMNIFDRHIEHSELYETTLNRKQVHKEIDMLEEVENKIINTEIKNAINKLSNIQKRRIKLYFFEDKNVEEIAKIENTSHQAVSESIRLRSCKVKKIIKK